MELTDYFPDKKHDYGLLVQNIDNQYYGLVDIVAKTSWLKYNFNHHNDTTIMLQFLLNKFNKDLILNELAGFFDSKIRHLLSIKPNNVIPKGHLGMIIIKAADDEIMSMVKFNRTIVDKIKFVPTYHENTLCLKPMKSDGIKEKSLGYFNCVWLCQNYELIPIRNVYYYNFVKNSEIDTKYKKTQYLLPIPITTELDKGFQGPYLEFGNMKFLYGKATIFGPFEGLVSQFQEYLLPPRYYAVFSEYLVDSNDWRDSQMLFPEDLI